MSDKTKEIIIKTNIVIAVAFLLLLFPILPIISFFIDENLLATFFYVDLVLFFISGVLLMVLIPIFGLKLKPKKAEKIHLMFENFEELSEHFESVTSSLGYQRHDVICFNDHINILIFTRKKFWSLDCLVIVRVSELTEDILDTANEKFKEFLLSYYRTEKITDWISLISIICVDRITPPFQKFVNSNIQQGFKNYILPVGVSFGGNTIYIAKQKDGLAVSKYKKLRKEFIKIINYSN